MMKRSQTKKISAMLAAVTVIWGGGTLFFGGDSVSAAVDQAAVLKKVVTDGNTSNLTPEEKTWFDGFFSGKTLQSGEKALQSGERGLSSTDKVLNEKEKNWLDAMSKTIKAEDSWIIAGNNNEAYYTGGTEIVYGSSNSYYIQSVALGHQNDSLGRNSLAVGRANATLGREGVSIGYSSVAGPYEGRQDKSSAVAIGERAYASGVGLAFGGYSVAMGTRGIALGYEAQAGKPEIAHMWDDYAYDSDPIYKDLIEHNPDIFGSYEDLKGKTGGETNANAAAKVEPMIFEHYKSYFSSIGINTLEDLRKKDNGQRLLRILGYQMVYSKDNVNYPIAIGTQAHAYSNGALALGTGSEVQGDYGAALGYRATVAKEINNGVALGAYSAVTKADMDEVNSSLKDKAPYSGITLRQSGNLGSDNNTNGEYLTGAISIGGPRYVQKNVNGNMQVVQEGNYVRQIKHLADGTDPTDAVNLRQLQAAVKGSGNTDTGGNTGGDTGNSAPSLSLEAGDNITITDKIGESNTKVISAPGITDIKNQVTDLNGRVDKVEDSMNTMNHRITKLDRRVDKVGAGAAALAALHPLDFDPDNKWDIAGGYGHYAGQSAMALGAYYRPNEDVMFSIGGAFGNGEDMINAGVSVKVGSGESKTITSKAAMAKKINELQQVVTTQHQQLEEQKANMAKQEARIQELEKIVQTLAK